MVLYESLLSLHMSNAELFSNAAKFMIKYLDDINLARKMLFKGIRIHKRCKSLYLDFFHIELEYAAKKRRQCEKSNFDRSVSYFRTYMYLCLDIFQILDSESLTKDPVLCGKTAEVIFLSGYKAINELKFRSSLLDVCSKYKFMKRFRKKIIKYEDILEQLYRILKASVYDLFFFQNAEK